MSGEVSYSHFVSEVTATARSHEKKRCGFFRTTASGDILTAGFITTTQSQGRAPDLPSRSRVVQSVSWVAFSSAYAFFLFSLTRSVAAAPAAEPAALIAERLQIVVDRLRGELGIPESVSVSVQPQVALVVSVEAPTDRGEPFRLTIEDRFLARLSAEERDAAIAHELGHVWVFTHHPYLQTERLANQIAMRVVSRDSLVSVYHQLWEHGGTKEDLAAFLGP